MEKDKTILLFIERLRTILNFSLIHIVDYWDSDLCAIGLKRGNKLVYISTYNFSNESIVKYDYDLEIIDEEATDKIEILKEGRGVSEREIVDELRSFLEV